MNQNKHLHHPNRSRYQAAAYDNSRECEQCGNQKYCVRCSRTQHARQNKHFDEYYVQDVRVVNRKGNEDLRITLANDYNHSAVNYSQNVLQHAPIQQPKQAQKFPRPAAERVHNQLSSNKAQNRKAPVSYSRHPPKTQYNASNAMSPSSKAVAKVSQPPMLPKLEDDPPPSVVRRRTGAFTGNSRPKPAVVEQHNNGMRGNGCGVAGVLSHGLQSTSDTHTFANNNSNSHPARKQYGRNVRPTHEASPQSLSAAKVHFHTVHDEKQLSRQHREPHSIGRSVTVCEYCTASGCSATTCQLPTKVTPRVESAVDSVDNDGYIDDDMPANLDEYRLTINMEPGDLCASSTASPNGGPSLTPTTCNSIEAAIGTQLPNDLVEDHVADVLSEDVATVDQDVSPAHLPSQMSTLSLEQSNSYASTYSQVDEHNTDSGAYPCLEQTSTYGSPPLEAKPHNGTDEPSKDIAGGEYEGASGKEWEDTESSRQESPSDAGAVAPDGLNCGSDVEVTAGTPDYKEDEPLPEE